LRCPVSHTQPAATTQHSQQFGRGARLVWGEHRAERGCDDIEGAIIERQLLSVSKLDAQWQSFRLGAPLGMPQQLGNIIATDHISPAPCRGQSRIARATGDIKHLFSRMHPQRANQHLPHHEQTDTNPMEVPGGPHLLLSFSDLAKLR
jgi:hypothetical protein